jgi:hypothetical protein
VKPGYYVLDPDGNTRVEYDLKKWGEWFQDIDNRRVGWHEFENGVHVSTVFLGLAHFGPNGTNTYFFETMVFAPTGQFGEEMPRYTRRYRTLREAAWGHSEVMAEVLENMSRDDLLAEGRADKEDGDV